MQNARQTNCHVISILWQIWIFDLNFVPAGLTKINFCAMFCLDISCLFFFVSFQMNMEEPLNK
jgi:hypothetical protein